MGIEEQPPDERRFAVVHGSDRREPQQFLVLVLLEVAEDVLFDERLLVHQKYPSRFFVSIDPYSSKSMSRPCRSEYFVRSISRMISGSVVADDGMAPESG